MALVTQQQDTLGVAPVCAALAVPRATYYRRHQPREGVPRVRPPGPRALPPEERRRVLSLLHADRFADLPPAQVYATLLDEGIFVCSIPTMYRLLIRAHKQVRERRPQRRHPRYAAPELLATRPNELWSWDITKLLGPAKWTYFYLYVILDVFSRYAVGWMVAHREQAALAERLLEATYARQGIVPGQLTVHADRGSSMTSKPVALLLADLGVTKTHSRPHVSNDNPYSESHFKTLKYRAEFPDRFGSLEHARTRVASSSSGTTMRITTRDSGCSRLTTCMPESPRRRSPSVPACSRRPTRNTPSASRAASRSRRRCRGRRGSTSPRSQGSNGPPAWFPGRRPQQTLTIPPGLTISTSGRRGVPPNSEDERIEAVQ